MRKLFVVLCGVLLLSALFSSCSMRPDYIGAWEKTRENYSMKFKVTDDTIQLSPEGSRATMTLMRQ